MGLFGPKEKIKVKKRPAGAIAYIEYRGPYGKIPFDEYMGKLYAFAKQAKVRPGWKPFAVYTTDPNTTPEAENVTLVAIDIAKEAPASGEVKVRTLPETEVAVMEHNAPAEEYKKSYAELGKWITDNGYVTAGPPLEIYTGKPKMKDGKMVIFSEIQFPVKRK
jgi:effector-binding domain-containing protein